MRFSFFFLSVLVAGCASTATARLPAADDDAKAPVVSIPNRWGDEMLLDLPPGSLTSQAALVRLSPDATCVDVVLRTISSATNEWELTAVVDDEATNHAQHTMPCAAGQRCVPSDSTLGSFATDGDQHIRRHGGRVCFEHAPRPKRELAIVARQGGLALRFEWRAN